MDKRRSASAIPKRTVRFCDDVSDSIANLAAARNVLCQQTPEHGANFLVHLSVCSSCTAKWPFALEQTIVEASKSWVKVFQLAEYLKSQRASTLNLLPLMYHRTN